MPKIEWDDYGHEYEVPTFKESLEEVLKNLKYLPYKALSRVRNRIDMAILEIQGSRKNREKRIKQCEKIVAVLGKNPNSEKSEEAIKKVSEEISRWDLHDSRFGKTISYESMTQLIEIAKSKETAEMKKIAERLSEDIKIHPAVYGRLVDRPFDLAETLDNKGVAYPGVKKYNTMKDLPIVEAPETPQCDK